MPSVASEYEHLTRSLRNPGQRQFHHEESLEENQPATSRTTWERFIAALLSVLALAAHRAGETFTLGVDNDRCAEVHYALLSDVAREFSMLERLQRSDTVSTG